jgi:hypothetical protein
LQKATISLTLFHNLMITNILEFRQGPCFEHLTLDSHVSQQADDGSIGEGNEELSQPLFEHG